jgi:hypothetical protein
VFGLGDINGTPRGKTAATVKKSAPLVAHNLVEVIAGRKADEAFDGYTSCPLITREGSAMLIEFDYEGRLTPSLPMIEPLQDSFFAWLMKYRMLKPAYWRCSRAGSEQETCHVRNLACDEHRVGDRAGHLAAAGAAPGPWRRASQRLLR